MKKKEKVLVLSAHLDDFVIGAGGTIANYTKEGKKVTVIIFSSGEGSHPWLKEKVIQKICSKETFAASKLLGCETIVFNLRDMKFREDYKNKKVEKEILKIIKKEKPTKIFTHSSEDPHPDHRSVYKITLELLEKISWKPETYIFSIWNPVSFKTENPSFYVDVSKTFSTKLKALRTFKSQQIHVAYPFFLLLYRALKDGFKIRKRFAEKFYRIQ